MSATALSFWWVFSSVNHGDYIKAVLDRNLAENITRVLYPNDNVSHCHVSQLRNPSLLHQVWWMYTVGMLNCSLSGVYRSLRELPLLLGQLFLYLPSFVLSVIHL